MKLKHIIVLLALLTAGIGGLVYFKQRESASTDTGSEKNSKLAVGINAFTNLDYSQITQVTIQNAKELLELELKDGIWLMKSKGGFPVGPDRLKDIIKGIAGTKISDVQEVGGRFLASKFQLGKPGSGSPENETGTLYTFMNAEGKVLNSFIVGKSAEGNGNFIKYEGVEGKVIRTNSSFPYAPATMDDWLETFRPNNVKSVTVTGQKPEESWKVFRDNETTGDWKLDAPQAGEEADSTKMAGVSGAFMAPPLKSILPPADKEKAAFDKPTRKAVIECFDGFIYTVTVGAGVAVPTPPAPPPADPKTPPPPPPPPTDYYVMVALEASLPEQLPPSPKTDPAPDATAEQKKAAEEAYAASEKTRQEEYTKKLPDLKARAAREKIMAGFQYIIPKTSLDSLFKNRPEFMKEKQPADQGAGIIPDPTAPVAPSPPTTPPTKKVVEAVTPPISVPIDPQPKEENKKPGEDKKAPAESPDPKAADPAKPDKKEEDKPKKESK